MIQQFPKDAKLPDGKLRVKFGIDPTGDRLHLGHLVSLLQVKRFAQLGHEIWLILGTQTAQLGDPSGRDSTRPMLTPAETQANATKLIAQLEKILPKGFIIFRNDQFVGESTGQLGIHKLLQILSKFTTQQLLSRDAFQKRLEISNPIGMHELVVPILQGWDSVFMSADIEVGGIDQLFNFQVTRKLQELEGQRPEICFLCPIINGTDGRKMSKSLGNCIFLDDEPNNMFGKVMSISDETMLEWLPLFMDDINTDAPPMKQKMRLASDIVAICHGGEASQQAWLNFEEVNRKGKLPDIIPEIQPMALIDAVAEMRKCSKSDARRLIESGGVQINDQQCRIFTDLVSGSIVRVGKRDFAKVK